MSRSLAAAFLVLVIGLLGGRPVHADTTIHAVGRLVYENPRGELVGADGIYVYVAEEAYGVDLCVNSSLGGEFTDENGYFDFTVVYSPDFFCDPDPDIRLKVSHTSVQTGITPNFGGGTIDYGTFRPSDFFANQLLHVWTVENRTKRWFSEHGYPSPSYYRSWFWYMGGTTSTFDSALRRKNLALGDTWNEPVIAGIIAQEWIDAYATTWSMDAINGVCDDASTTVGEYPFGGYCLWCTETDVIAWHMGFSAWVADQVVGEFPSRYGDTPIYDEGVENLQSCPVAAWAPWTTPGLFAAVLRDISDTTNENDPTFGGPGWDAMSVGPDAILGLFATHTMATPNDFFNAFKTTYPGLCSELSHTALNNGFIIDTAPPSPVTNLASPSHTVGVASTDNTVDLTWTRPVDDCETASQFSIRWGASPALPDEVAEVTDASSYTTPVLSAGTWYFTIRSGDAIGNWDGSYDTLGPIIIQPPGPANLTHVLQSGWVSRVTPRPAGDAAPGNVPGPASLTGNAAATWWNASVANTGGATAPSTGLWVQADGIGFYNPLNPVDHAASVPSLAAGADYEALNLGPITVRGGRHTFGAFNDFTGLVAESNETDNYWATQWIWSPYVLPVEGSTFRSAPPARMGGFSGSIATTWFNCDGVRMQATATGSQWWNAVTLVASAHDADYDARLHTASTAPTNGFGSAAAYSARPADCLDAVIANRNLAGDATWDVGVVQATDTPSLAGYEVRHVTSTLETYGTPRSFTLGANEWMSLHEVFMAGSDLGPVSFVVRDNNGSNATFHISWLDVPFVTGGMDDYTATAVSNDEGVARLDVTATNETYSCLVVYRDPKDGPADSRDFTIDIDRTPPDLVPGALAGWDGPLVVRPAADGTPSSVPAPTMLPGWTASSYYNAIIHNAGPTTAVGAFAIDLDLDGVNMFPLASAGDLLAYDTIFGNDIGPFYVRGGRHTAAMRIDWPDDVEEISETNNHIARQWAWSPQVLATGPTTGLPAPGDPLGSWEHLDWSDPTVIWSNADGYRTPAFDPGGADGYWGGVAVMPGDSSDVTLRLHGTLDDVDLSFGEALTTSDFGTSEIDFNLIDFTYWNPGPFDVGVSGGYGTQDFTAEVVSSTYLANNPAGSYGTFNLGANEMLNLHEVDLPAGFYQIRLENLSAGADLGLSIHPPEVGVMSRIDALPDGAAWLQVAGEDEQIVLEIPTTGLYCIAVWKARPSTLPMSADYNLVFNEITAAEGTPITTTPLMAAYPNPFTSGTVIAFNVPKTGPVFLDVFDVRGRRVRRLVGEERDAGAQEASWNGEDESGRPVASGIYLVRLAAEGANRVTRIALTR
jgi:hypothetical protein